MRALFLIPRIDRPAGGHAIIFEHVKILRDNGIDATAQFSGGTDKSYYETQLPKEAMGRGDGIKDRESFLVIPEADLIRYGSDVLQARGDDLSKVVILNQNHFYTFNHRDDVASWTVFKNSAHIATSKAIAAFLKDITGLPSIPLVPVFIRHDIFRPAPKILRIAYMPRKRPEDAQFVRRAVSEIAPDQRSIEWIEIEDKSQEEVAAILNNSAIFISFARREGFGMPALEAMAAGCIVVGFTGGGGDEYAADDNGLWIQEDDTVTLARTIARVCRDARRGAPYLHSITQNARARAARYARPITERALIEVWSRLSGTRFELHGGTTS